MKLISGLGNPGKQYERNRHNAGFLMLDVLAKKLKAPPFSKKTKWNAEISEIDDLILLRPLTYMNNSGTAISAAAHFFKIKPADIWLIYDDIDLPLGTIRIREGGGSGTHNGMKSVIEHLGTEAFPRIRIGIESREHPEKSDLHDFVLGNIGKEEWKIFEQTLLKASDAILYALKHGAAKAASTFHAA